jgi:hypothetical protein
MHSQTLCRLRLDRENGQSAREHAETERLLNLPNPSARKQDQFACLLKRQADEIMRAVTECPPAALPQATARLRDLSEVIRFAVANGLVDADERQLSGPNLLHLHTLADYQAALDITRQQNRAPVFASRWSQELAELNAKLDAVLDRQESLAGLVAMRNGHNGNGGLQ